MRKASSSTTFDCDVDTFWKTFLSEEYNRKFYIEKLGFPQFEVLSQTDTERRLRVVPKLNMPGPVMKILGDSFGYEEEGRLDKAKNAWHWKMIPNTMRDKLKTEGIVRIEAAGDGKCRRTDEVTMEAKIFGIGGLIESSTEKEVRAAWAAEASFMRTYLLAK
jgi:hypothetical protein